VREKRDDGDPKGESVSGHRRHNGSSPGKRIAVLASNKFTPPFGLKPSRKE
jgi:hypothetical protein